MELVFVFFDLLLLTDCVLRFHRKQKACCKALDFRNAWNECLVYGRTVSHTISVLQITMCIGNNIPNASKARPRQYEAHREYKYRPAPLSIDQRCEDILKDFNDSFRIWVIIRMKLYLCARRSKWKISSPAYIDAFAWPHFPAPHYSLHVWI